MNAICNQLFETQPAESSRTHDEVAGLTEILLSQAGESLKLVSSMLAHLSSEDDGRWFTWVNPPQIGKRAFEKAGFKLSAFRALRFPMVETQKRQAFDDLLDALRLGNSRTLVTSLDSLTQRQSQLLEEAANIGNTRCIVLRPR